MVDINRQTGRSTRQMQAAPQRSVYVWPNHFLQYPKLLAHHINRNDLRIISPGALVYNPGSWCGAQVPIIVDHDAHLTQEQLEVVEDHNATVKVEAAHAVP